MIGLTGASTILFQLFVYKRLSAFLGLVRSFRFGLACFSLLTALVPLSHFVLKVSSVFMWMYTGTLFVVMKKRKGGGGEMMVLTFCIFSRLQTCASQMLFSSVFALISNSTEKEAMGRVNGVSQSLVALFRAIGPPIAGNLFAWSIRDLGRSFPFNFFFNYLVSEA
jgi:Na+/melibiose symporter-like transporter